LYLIFTLPLISLGFRRQIKFKPPSCQHRTLFPRTPPELPKKQGLRNLHPLGFSPPFSNRLITELFQPRRYHAPLFLYPQLGATLLFEGAEAVACIFFLTECYSPVIFSWLLDETSPSSVDGVACVSFPAPVLIHSTLSSTILGLIRSFWRAFPAMHP